MCKLVVKFAHKKDDPYDTASGHILLFSLRYLIESEIFGYFHKKEIIIAKSVFLYISIITICKFLL